ncbi:helix-turn-helix domain-containing protein [Olsenella profusa]|uniref:Helix-turn-helix transcriptional regulator n=1 Tax=Olsenella profusa TaxID=138595 RepID=A0ABS2F1Q8_9ACTN|nr:helix-turn-helix transcriptional regulator [Olsenella profusa]MBM6774911.1 helix-turn-helix transcriptional regulator [Olsenella profusa]
MDETRLKIAFGSRCWQLRDQTGLSQERLALSIGMDRSYYASIETGARNVTLVNMSKIANGLGVSLSELLRGVER